MELINVLAYEKKLVSLQEFIYNQTISRLRLSNTHITSLLIVMHLHKFTCSDELNQLLAINGCIKAYKVLKSSENSLRMKQKTAREKRKCEVGETKSEKQNKQEKMHLL